MVTTPFQVTGMTCEHCEQAVRGEVAKLPGVDSVEVNAGTGTLMVSSAAGINIDAVIAAAEEAGYQAVSA